jgi:hypothetical protein
MKYKSLSKWYLVENWRRLKDNEKKSRIKSEKLVTNWYFKMNYFEDTKLRFIPHKGNSMLFKPILLKIKELKNSNLKKFIISLLKTMRQISWRSVNSVFEADCLTFAILFIWYCVSEQKMFCKMSFFYKSTISWLV